MAIIFSDDINDQRGADLSKRVDTLYDYIGYMKEQLEFWARNRTREISEADKKIAEVTATIEDIAPHVLNYFSQVAANTSRTFSVPNSTRGLILLQRGSDTAGTSGLYSLVSTTQGAIYISALSPASDVTFSNATNALTIANSGNNIYMSYIGNKMITG